MAETSYASTPALTLFSPFFFPSVLLAGTLLMFDAVLISERLGDPGIKPFMRATFGAAAGAMEFPAANRGLFTHAVDSKMRAGWRRSVPQSSLKLMLKLNALDIKLYWFADKLLDSRLEKFKTAK